MKDYDIYRNLQCEIKKKSLRLSDLKKKSSCINAEIEKLEVLIEEERNGLNMIFDYLILQKEGL